MVLPAAPPEALASVGDWFHHWSLSELDEPAIAAAEAACRRAVLDVLPEPGPGSSFDEADCDSPTLLSRLGEPDAWSDVSVMPTLSNMVALHNGRLPADAEAAVAGPREALTVAMVAALERRGWCPEGTAWAMSGHLWYRAGTGLGWHTNTRVPGWRAYLTWTEEPGGESYFRYRDPSDGSIVTSVDTGLDLRLFHVSATEPFWHCIWAGAERHSFGYRLVDTGAG